MAEERGKKILSLLFKIGLTALAFFLVYRKVDLDKVGGLLQSLHWGYLILAFIPFALSKVFESLRLNIFFRCKEVQLSEKANFKLYLLGMFYNLFLPGGIGGDGYKVYWLKRNLDAPIKDMIWLSLVNRGAGIMGLLIIILSLSPFIPKLFKYQSWLPLLIPVGILTYELIVRTLFKAFKGKWLITTIYSILSQGTIMLTAHCILLAMGVTDDILNYWALFMVSGIAFMIPIFLGGAGSRELVFSELSVFLLIDPEVGITLSLLFFIVRAVFSFSGIYYLMRPGAIGN